MDNWKSHIAKYYICEFKGSIVFNIFSFSFTFEEPLSKPFSQPKFFFRGNPIEALIYIFSLSYVSLICYCIYHLLHIYAIYIETIFDCILSHPRELPPNIDSKSTHGYVQINNCTHICRTSVLLLFYVAVLSHIYLIVSKVKWSGKIGSS